MQQITIKFYTYGIKFLFTDKNGQLVLYILFENPPEFGLLSAVRKPDYSSSAHSRGQSSEWAVGSHVRRKWQ